MRTPASSFQVEWVGRCSAETTLSADVLDAADPLPQQENWGGRHPPNPDSQTQPRPSCGSSPPEGRASGQLGQLSCCHSLLPASAAAFGFVNVHLKSSCVGVWVQTASVEVRLRLVEADAQPRSLAASQVASAPRSPRGQRAWRVDVGRGRALLGRARAAGGPLGLPRFHWFPWQGARAATWSGSRSGRSWC